MKNLVLMGGISMLALALAACGDDTGGAGGGGEGGSGTTSTSTSTSSSTSSTTTSTSSTTTSTTSTSSGDGGSGGEGGEGGGGTTSGGDGGAGGDGGGGGSEPSSVVEVDCAGAEIAEDIGTSGLAFDPDTTTIAAGEIVRFTPTGPHDMTSDDGLFATTTSEVACLRFDAAGDFPYHCSVHGAGMAGTVVVQ